MIGVVEDVRFIAPDQPAPTIVYWPAFIEDFYRTMPFYIERAVAFTVRSALAGTPSLAREIERAVWSVNPDLPLANVRTMQEIRDRSLARTSFTLVMLVLAAVAAVLTLVAVVASYLPAQRASAVDPSESLAVE